MMHHLASAKLWYWAAEIWSQIHECLLLVRLTAKSIRWVLWNRFLYLPFFKSQSLPTLFENYSFSCRLPGRGVIITVITTANNRFYPRISFAQKKLCTYHAGLIKVFHYIAYRKGKKINSAIQFQWILFHLKILKNGKWALKTFDTAI